MKLIGLVAAGVMLASAGAAQAAEWRLVEASANRTVGIDRESITITGSTKTFWVVLVEKEVDEKGGDYFLSRFSINCETKMSRMMSVYRYGEESDAQISGVSEPQPWQDVIPGTLGESLSVAVCEDVWASTMMIENLLTFVTAARVTMRY